MHVHILAGPSTHAGLGHHLSDAQIDYSAARSEGQKDAGSWGTSEKDAVGVGLFL